MLLNQNKGSFRDPEGAVFEVNNRIFRGIKKERGSKLKKFLSSDFFIKRSGNEIVETRIITSLDAIDAGLSHNEVNLYDTWLEHDRIELITYPYEWCFEQLKDAAIFYLGLKIDAINCGFEIKDSTAFNIQFKKGMPTFIDILSFERYKEGNSWIGYKQFCEQFLVPLVLNSIGKIDFNPWLKGSPDGLSIPDASKMLPFKSYLSPVLLGHIHAQAWAISKISSTTEGKTLKNIHISKKNLLALLHSLMGYIKNLKPAKIGFWGNYADHNSYTSEAAAEKEMAVKYFIRSIKPKTILDIGCNSGNYSCIAFNEGADQVIGLDFDEEALNIASKRHDLIGKKFSSLRYDFTNPSPDLGWNLKERLSLKHRLPKIEGVICLALIHHLVIGKNIPLNDFIEWLVSLSPSGIIEFVPKTDPMVMGLLKNRVDIFEDYTEKNFLRILGEYSEILSIHSSEFSTRKLITYRVN